MLGLTTPWAEATIKIREAEEGLHIFKSTWSRPLPNDWDLLHIHRHDASGRDDVAHEFNRGIVELKFLTFGVKVVLPKFGKN